jgi:hypothetical protein
MIDFLVMIQMKRLPITFIALAALFGVISCIAIEPALAQLDSHHTEFAGEEEGHCDFICHSSHHVWNVGSSETLINQPLQSLGSIVFTYGEVPDPPLKGIFQPPTVLA